MKPIMKKLLYGAFIIGTLVVVLLMANRSGDLGSAVAAIRHMRLRYVWLGGLLTIGGIFTQALSACSAVRAMGQRIGLFDMFRISFSGEFYSSVTPGASGGQPMAVYQMHKRHVPVGDATSALLIHFLCFQLMLTVFATVLGVAYRGFIVQQVGRSLPVLIVGYVYNLFVIALTAALCFTRKPVRWAIEKLVYIAEKLGLKKLAAMRETMLETADQFYTASQVLKHNRAEVVRQLFFGALRLTLLMSVMACVYRGLGFSAYGYGSLLTMSVMQYVSAAYTPLPGASGAQESVFGLYFSALLPGSSLFSGMLAWRFITYYLVLILGALVTGTMGLGMKKGLADGGKILEMASHGRGTKDATMPIDEAAA